MEEGLAMHYWEWTCFIGWSKSAVSFMQCTLQCGQLNFLRKAILSTYMSAWVRVPYGGTGKQIVRLNVRVECRWSEVGLTLRSLCDRFWLYAFCCRYELRITVSLLIGVVRLVFGEVLCHNPCIDFRRSTSPLCFPCRREASNIPVLRLLWLSSTFKVKASNYPVKIQLIPCNPSNAESYKCFIGCGGLQRKHSHSSSTLWWDAAVSTIHINDGMQSMVNQGNLLCCNFLQSQIAIDFHIGECSQLPEFHTVYFPMRWISYSSLAGGFSKASVVAVSGGQPFDTLWLFAFHSWPCIRDAFNILVHLIGFTLWMLAWQFQRRQKLELRCYGCCLADILPIVCHFPELIVYFVDANPLVSTG